MKENFNLLSSPVSGPERQREIIAAARSRQTPEAKGAMHYETVTGRPSFGGFISSQVRLARASVCSSTVARSGSIFRTRPSSSMMTAGRLPPEELARYDSSPAFDMP